MNKTANDNDPRCHERKGKAEAQDQLEQKAVTLEASGRYRVLRKLQPISQIQTPVEKDLCVLIVLDCETTGLVIPGTQAKGEIPSECISLAMIALAYRPETGEIVGTLGTFDRLRQPLFPIPNASTRIHGLTDAMVEGKSFSSEEIALWIASMTALCPGGLGDPLCIAMNASFDRPILQSHFDIFEMLPWSCSQTQIPWSRFGYEGVKLAYLASEAGFFYDRHRALDDCWAVAELLRRRLDGITALAHLLDAAYRPAVRIVAVGAPFDTRGILKQRNYRWNPGRGGGPKAWSAEVPEDEREIELAFLREHVLPAGTEPIVTVIDAYQRFTRDPQRF